MADTDATPLAPKVAPDLAPLDLLPGAGTAAGPVAEPHRIPDATEGLPTAPPAPDRPGPTPADAPWETVFGSPSLGPDLEAVAVDGPKVYIGGNFTYAMAGTANATYNRVAEWDGRGWKRMGLGVDATVRAIAVVGDDVFVGGDLTLAGGTVAVSHLARWDGASWSPVAGGVSDPDGRFGTTVEALATDGRTLYVGGTFTRAGDVAVRSLAALDLATGTWSDVGGGVGSTWSPDPMSVHALAVDGTSLHVGGSFERAGEVDATSFATFDTATGRWTAYDGGITDDGMTGRVRALAVDPTSGSVFVGGRFTTAGGVQAWNMAVLRGGTLAAVGDASSFGGAHAEVRALAVVAGTLYAGGSFTAIDGVEAAHWARLDDGSWSAVAPLDNDVTAMAPTTEGSIVVLGAFGWSGDLRVVHGGTWNGAGWETFGQGVTADPYGNGAVHALSVTTGGAYVGGLFDQAGQLPVRSIARWTGTAWDPMAGGVTAAISHGQVFALLELEGDLYVGGRFDAAGGVPAANIARWDGRTWSTLGAGVDGTVFALAVLGGRLYAGGNFNTAGGIPASRLASFDPATGTWAAVGHNPTFDDDIRALAVIADQWLVIGGDFHRFFVNGLPAADGLWGLALFDTGRPLGDDPLAGYLHIHGTSRYGGTGMVNALHVLDGDLYVGGWFDRAGVATLGPAPSPGFAAANLAVWHVSGDRSWEGVGGADHTVNAFTTVDGTLAVGGAFSEVGGVRAARVARFDPGDRSWSALGTGLTDGAGGGSVASSLAQSAETGLWVGGSFPVAGAGPSANVALWTATRRGS
jgi:trimeric autotransporter adhesin